MRIEFVSSTDFPWTGVGNLEIPFNTFRLGDKWATALAVADSEDPHNDIRPQILIDGEASDIELRVVGWAYGPLEVMANYFGMENHGWRNSSRKEHPYPWLRDRLAEVYGDLRIGPKEPVTVVLFEPISAAELDAEQADSGPDTIDVDDDETI